MFAIDPQNPAKLTVVGKPAAVPGEFPVTVAATANLMCVGTSGGTGGVSCASFSNEGLGAMDALRPFGLNQTTPPVGPFNTVSQVFFSRDAKILYVTVKGDTPNNKTGFLASFAVRPGTAVSAKAKTSSPDGTSFLFGSTTIPGSEDIFVTDATFGAVVLSVDAATGAATVRGRGVVAGQRATCWAEISPATGNAFTTDGGLNRLAEMSAADASVIGVVDLSDGDPLLTDLAAAGRFVYALSAGNGTTQAAVAVLDAATKKQVQHLQLQGLGLDKNAQGLAVLK